MALFDTEIAFYEQQKERLIHEHTNRHLLIKGNKLINSFATRDAAVKEGVRRFGRGPFLVRLSGENTPTVTVPALSLGILTCPRS